MAKAKRPVKTAARKSQPARRSTSTALAKRPSVRDFVRTGTVLPAAVEQHQEQGLATLTDEPSMGALGLVELRLTEKEEAILSEPVNPNDVMIKPEGGAVYISHPHYSRWFSRAFGRTGWSLRPVSKPMKAEKSVCVHYIMFVHGQPVAYALGEQEYFGGEGGNKQQTYGDAIESTVASAMRRCAKRLGVGLELWDKRWVNEFIERHVVHVKVLVKDSVKTWARRRDDPPFWQERAYKEKHGGRREERHDDEPSNFQRETGGASGHPHTPPEYRHPAEGNTITEPQTKRLFAILRESNRTNQELHAWLEAAYGIKSVKDIRRSQYDEICKHIENRGPLGS